MNKKWWHDKVAYQIYPKSFRDTNGDGIGDLKGITQKLDYLKDLGIDIIWLSPIYQSPFIDEGYDISDYYQIDEAFGTMEDFDTLLAEAKKRDIHILMDLVINHCSNQHEWFRKALRDPEGEYGDYFYFRKGKDGNPPSNYRSYFGGSAWEKVEGTDYYYLHMFAKEQPDLNWNNRKMLNELYTMINWWLEKGVSGFRIDAIINIKKDLDFESFEPDGPDGLAWVWRMVEKVEGVGELLEDLKKNTFERYEAFTVAEVFNMKENELAQFIGDDGHFSSMFDFCAHSVLAGKNGPYGSTTARLEQLKHILFQSQLKCLDVGFMANVLENHDCPRCIDRYLPSYAQNISGATMLGTISILFRGIPFLYQGQEIGMRNCRMDSIDDYDDIGTRWRYQTAIESGIPEKEALESCYHTSRDNARTPMQWDSSNNAGFTAGKPWLKVNPNYTEINVEAQLQNEDSILSYYKKLLALRRSPEYRKVFTYGTFLPLLEDTKGLLAYERKLGDKSASVFANFGEKELTVKAEALFGAAVLLSNQKNALITDGQITLAPCQVIVTGK